MNFRNLNRLVLGPALCLLLPGLSPVVQAASEAGLVHSPTGRYVVQLADPPLAAWSGGETRSGLRLKATSPEVTGLREDRFNTPEARAYLAHLDERRQAVLYRHEAGLKRVLEPAHVYRYALNGMTLSLDPAEAARMARDPDVASVEPEFARRLETDAGPEWVGAPDIWLGGTPGAGAGTSGAGVVIGIVDSGINPDHPSFADVGGDGHDHDNPRGRRFGLCASGGGGCNDKLIGIHDFTDEGTSGRDAEGHGSHVASTAAGNHVNARLRGETLTLEVPVSGVAPHANIISYKACNAVSEEEEGNCPGGALLDAIDQAVEDGVDVLNYSIGGLVNRTGPWTHAESRAMRNARGSDIVVVSSAGNNGPVGESISLPAVAPWVIAVGNSSHDRQFINRLENLSGGQAPPPMTLTGVGFTDGLDDAPIVHAVEFGEPLCGEGEMNFPPTGESNPFPDGTFNGEIVVCDRGIYARVEKGFNVEAAGAGGYVLANTREFGASVVSDDHFLPAVHLDFEQSEKLRAWLAAGGERRGSISGATRDIDPAFADVVSASSSRGPGAFTPNVMKPDITAPGTSILGAQQGEDGASNRYQFLSGTSMASPHVAGAAALLRAARPAWSAAEIHSALVMTADAGPVTDDAGRDAGALVRGGGRLDVSTAVNAGLVLHESVGRFIGADPESGGEPADLNLPGLADHECFLDCGWVRTVKATRDGVTWRAEVDAPPGVEVRVTPEEFTLDSREDTRRISIQADVRDGPVGEWIDGSVRFEPVAGGGRLPNPVRMPLNVFVSGGGLPEQTVLKADARGGSEFVGLEGLVALPDLALTPSGLQRGVVDQRTLRQDDTRGDPYDNFNDGTTFFKLVNVVEGDTLLVAEVLSSDAGDIDLYVGRDTGNERPNLREERCASNSPGVLERCQIKNPEPGTYWILVQNWEAVGGSNDVRLAHAVVPGAGGGITATGPSRVDVLDSFDVRVSWDDNAMEPDSRWYGTVSLGTDPGNPGNLGMLPVVLERTADTALAGRALVPGKVERFQLPGDMRHLGLFVDVPPGATQLTVEAEIDGNGILDLFAAFEREPAGETADEIAADADYSSTQFGRVATLMIGEGDGLEPGRWFIVPFNDTFAGRELELHVEVETKDEPFAPKHGMWFNPDRPGHGLDINRSGERLFIVWFTYLEDGTPAWYLAEGSFESDIWTADLVRHTWDGKQTRSTEVGEAVLTFHAEDEVVFSWRLFGRSGSEPMVPCEGGPGCIPGGLATPVDKTGHWFSPSEPGWGDTVVTKGDLELHTLYIYDRRGNPRWLQGVNRDRTDNDVTDLLAFEGFCPVCELVPTATTPAGTIETAFRSQTRGTFQVDVTLPPAYPGGWVRDNAGMSMLSDPVDQ